MIRGTGPDAVRSGAPTGLRGGGRAASARRGRYGWLLELGCLWLICPALVFSAEEPAARFRRVFVPESEITRLDAVYLPVKRAEFEQLLSSVRAKQAAAGLKLETRIAEATYSARVMNNELLDGQADLRIVHSGKNPATLSLEPCGLVIGEATWEMAQSPAPGGTPPPKATEARLGLNDRQELVAYVENSGGLHFTWSLKGGRGLQGEQLFELRLPACPVNHLLLQVPDGFKPLAERGFAFPLPDSLTSEGFQSWMIELGGQTSAVVRVIPASVDWRTQGLVLLRQLSTHRFTPSVTELRVELNLEIYHQALSHLTLALDQTLELVQAEDGERRLSWSQAAGADAGPRLVELDLNPPLLGAGHVLRLRALAPASLGPGQTLPLISVPEVFLQENRLVLEIPRPLALERLQLTGCRQDAVAAQPAGEGGEVVRLQGLEPRPEIQVRLQRREPEASIQAGTSIRLGRAGATAQLVAEVTTTDEQLFEVEFQQGAYWTLDSVDTDPPTALEEWTLGPITSQGRRILLRLREPVTPEHPVQMLLHAQGNGLGENGSVSGGTLRLGTFHNARNLRSLVSLGAEPGRQLRFAGGGDLPRLDPAKLPAAEARRITPFPGGVVYVEQPGTEAWSVGLSSEEPNYAAEINVDALVEDKSIQQTIRIRCQPKASSLGQLTVHLSGAAEEPLKWSFPSEPRLTVEASRVSPDESPAVGGPAGETWQVVLPHTLDTPFELLAERTLKFGSECVIPLASLPRAVSQSGRLAVRTPGLLPIVLDYENLRPVPAESTPPGQLATIRGSFRYEPAEASRVQIRRTATNGQPARVWAWAAQLTSRVARDGRAVHTVVYQLENGGAPQLLLTRPPQAQGLAVAVDGRELPLPAAADAAEPIPVPLPRANRYPAVRVEFATAGPALGMFGQVTAPWPVTDLTILARSWQIWLPAGYERWPSPKSGAGLSWSQRLGGPVVRPSHLQPFDPTSARDWRSLWNPTSCDIPEDVVETLEVWLQALGAAVASPAASDQKPATWGAVLAGLGTLETDADQLPVPKLWLDQGELSNQNLTSATLIERPLNEPPDENAADQDADAWPRYGAQALEQARLGLIIHRDWYLLTSVDNLTLLASELVPGPYPNIAFVGQSGPLTAAVGQPSNPRYVSVETWPTLPHATAARWLAESRPTSAALANAGWVVHTVAIPWRVGGEAGPETAVSVQVYRPGIVQAWGWALLLLTASAVWCVGRRLPLLVLPAVVVAGLSALFCPGVCAPLAGGAFLGSLLAAALVLFRRNGAPASAAKASPASSGSVHSLLTSSAPLMWAALLTLSGTTVLAADAAVPGSAAPPGKAAPAATRPNGLEPGESKPNREPAPAPTAPPAASVIHRVYSPVDEAGQAVGEYLFVPRPFYDTLHRDAATGGAAVLKWMIRKAEYRVLANRVTLADESAAIELTARYELEVFKAGTKVLLPIAADQVYLLPNRARLDSQPAAVAWTADGGSLSVEVNDAGVPVLELAFRPRIERREGNAGFEMRIPRVARSQVRFDVSWAMSEFQLPSALGGEGLDSRTGERLRDLGPTDRLSVQWPIEAAPAAGTADVAVDQYLWLRIQPGAVTLDARFKFTSPGQPLRQVRLELDPRLRMLPPQADQPLAEYYVRSGERPLAVLALKPPFRKQVTVQASFILRDSSGIGKLVLPRLTPDVDKPRRQLWGVSIDSGLDCDLPPPSVESKADFTAFLSVWGVKESSPQAVLSLAPGKPEWTLLTKLRTPRVTAEQALEIAVGMEGADLAYVARVAVAHGAVFQHRLQVPGDVAIQSVSIKERDVERVARWSRDENGDVLMMLNSAVSGAHEVQLKGRLPLPEDGWLTVPPLTLQGADSTDAKIDILRRADALVRLADGTGYTPAADRPLGEYRAGWGRLVASLTASATPAALRLEVKPNRPHVQGRLVIVLSRDETAWRALADCHLQIADGVLDAVRLDIPEEWAGNFQWSPEALAETVPIPGQTRRYLVLRPAREATGSFRLQVGGNLAVGAGQRVRAPDILPVDMTHLERFLIAPRVIQQRQIAWDVTSLRATTFPEGYTELDPTTHVCYQAFGTHLAATIRDVKVELGSPLVRLADYRVACGAGGELLGVALFDVEPAGERTCELELPAGQQLLSVQVADLPALLERIDPQHWRVSLTAQHLPQTVQVVFADRLPPNWATQAAGTVLAPQLLHMPVEQTLWTVRGPGSLSPAQTGLVPSEDSRPLEFCRLRHMAAAMQTAASVVAESVPEDLARWYRPWALRWQAVRSRIAPLTEADAQTARDGRELATLDAQAQALAANLQAAGVISAEPPEASALVEPPQLAASCWERGLVTQYWTCNGAAAALAVQAPKAPERSLGERLVAALLLIGIVLAVSLLFPHTAWGAHLARRAPLVGLLCGGAWWWWGVLSWLGALVGLLSFLVACSVVLPARRAVSASR